MPALSSTALPRISIASISRLDDVAGFTAIPMYYPSGFRAIFALAAFLLCCSAPSAHAGSLGFGTDESIRFIQTSGDPNYELCYKTSTFFFGAGCYVKDDGYVLRRSGVLDRYIELTPEKISELQQDGILPTPMPEYSLSVFDYLFGYSNWIILGATVGIPALRSWFAKRRTKVG